MSSPTDLDNPQGLPFAHTIKRGLETCAAPVCGEAGTEEVLIHTAVEGEHGPTEINVPLGFCLRHSEGASR